MRINIGSLVGQQGSSLTVERELPGDFLNDVPEVRKVVSPLEVQVEVSNTGEGFRVTGNLRLRAVLICTRCLREFTGELSTEIEEEYRRTPVTDFDHNGEDFFPEDDIPLVDGDEIDLTDLIRDSMLVSIPMKVVCDESCPGLCPTCGAVLAEESCDCDAQDIDIRLAPLKALLKTQERRKDNGSTKEKTFKSEN